MASADDNYGKLQLIDPDDDSDDGETASGVIPGIKHAVTTEGVQNDEDVGANLKLGFIVIVLLDFIHHSEKAVEN